jgi:asparagine synthase (glutamine-hydrolysing)
MLWSNSIRVLLQNDIEAELDPRALDAYFAMGYVPAPWTLLKRIRKVPAGQFLEWKGGQPTHQRHWGPVSQSRPVRNVRVRGKQLKERLCRSLDEMVEGHDRVGVLLSSGVDSSLLVGLLHCELGVSVEAFTFQYSGYEGKYNEYDRARRLTRLYDIPHHKIDYSAEWLRDKFSRAVCDYEGPFSYGNHTARLKEVRDMNISLLLNGILPQSSFISRTATFALRLEGATSKSVGRCGRYLLRKWCPDGHSRFRHALDVIASSAEKLFYSLVQDTVVPELDRKNLYAEERRVDVGRESMLRLFEREVHDTGLNRKAERLAHLRNQFALPDHLMWWHYRWAQANNLTTGAPYVHSDVRSWMQSLRQPVWPLHQEWVGKVLIREAAALLMPEDIAHEPKIAQSVPFWRWFQGPLRPLLFEYLKPTRLERIGLFNVDFVQQALQQHITGKVSRPYLLWTLLCFMVWEDEFLEGKHTK